MLKIANNWKDYELLDTGNGEKLERWKNVILRRPDPQAIWEISDENKWKCDAHYHRSSSGGGSWEYLKKIPQYWTINYRDLTFKIAPTGFKHTGLFPEQAANWDWMREKIEKSGRDDIRILNLFAYTGGATCMCAKAGAKEVVHVDASKGMIQWAKENVQLSNLQDKTIRFLVDDAIKFLQREIRRGRTYHGIIMDPPSYGRGPNGEVWQIGEKLNELIALSQQVLAKDALFFLLNSYTTGFSPLVLQNLLNRTLYHTHKGKIYAGELGLPTSYSQDILPCGIYARWENND